MKKNNIIILVVSIILTGIFVYSLFFATPKFNVTYNTDGGSKVSAEQVKKNSTATKPADPTKEGYTFKEWQVNGVTYNFTTPITKDTEITAIWEKVPEKTEDKKTTKKTTTKKTTTTKKSS